MRIYLHYKPTKVDLICGILDYWDPLRARDTPSWYDHFYNYEAEEIAQGIRKNSSPQTVAKKVKSVYDDACDEVYGEEEGDEDVCHRYWQ